MRFKIFAITAAILLLSQPAAAKTAKHNIVVQSYRDIQNSNMYEPGFNQGGYEARVKQKQKESVIAVAEPDEKPAEDYNEKIAGELFKKDMSPVTVELLEPRTGVRVNVGQPLQILLPEDENSPTKWYYGGNELKHVRIAEDYRYMGQRIINVNILEPGKEKVFFDLIDDSGEKINVLGSRVLNITAE